MGSVIRSIRFQFDTLRKREAGCFATVFGEVFLEMATSSKT